jgi:hypothetical protein
MGHGPQADIGFCDRSRCLVLAVKHSELLHHRNSYERRRRLWWSVHLRSPARYHGVEWSGPPFGALLSEQARRSTAPWPTSSSGARGRCARLASTLATARASHGPAPEDTTCCKQRHTPPELIPAGLRSGATLSVTGG